MSDKELGKAYLVETISAAFHDDIIQEVKLNISELHDFFDRQGLTYQVLLDLIKEYDSNSITKLLVKDALVEQANRSEEEANHLVSKIIESRKMNPEEVDVIKKRFRYICNQTYIEKAKSIAGDDLELYKNLLSTYKYKDLGSSDFIIKDFEDLDATTLAEKYLNNPIAGGYEFINKCFAGKSGYLRSSLGLVCGRPKSGKSLFLMEEAVAFACNGHKVFYLALGDLNDLDFLVRMSSIATKTSMDMVYSEVDPYKQKAVAHFKKNGGKINLTTMPAGKLSPSEFYTIAMNRLKGYDVCIVDYDLNFQEEVESMYIRGGMLYNLLTEVKDTNNQLWLVATQPNKAYWDEPFLDDTCFIESSKKSMIVDFAVTIGKVAPSVSGTHCGYMNMAINRRGGTPNNPYIKVNTGHLVVVPESIYAQYSADPVKRDFGYKELQMYIAASESQHG